MTQSDTVHTGKAARPQEPVVGTAEYRLLWSIPGHAVIAKLAEALLNEDSPAAKKKLAELIASDPREGRDELANYATWPDEMKKDPAFKAKTEAWHYITLPFTPGEDRNNPLPGGAHVLSAMNEQLHLLTQGTDATERADALAFVSHFVGDIHQPLHCTSLVNSQFPKGDRGGNDFKLVNGNNMHSLWDGLVASRAAELTTSAELLRARYPKEQFAARLAVTDFEQWIWQSHELGREAYVRILAEPAETRASQAYLDWAREKAGECSALAAYRLAELLANALK
ncbi:S1/P1 nuclease [Archangium lansingense]|uniref:S1/P1 nuclease n=1 Tax=Archangium lansingense TaxID=2995310 RepID=A0ABT4AKX2_9BACT|nr:S1/P1 nuclease [Archangium lansinium]MCY1082350.1 S1/P1 nuclease [Archangium lansinium]